MTSSIVALIVVFYVVRRKDDTMRIEVKYAAAVLLAIAFIASLVWIVDDLDLGAIVSAASSLAALLILLDDLKK